MGTNHPGEIEYLAQLTSATVGVVTNAGPAHLEALGSIQGVALEKGAMFASLRANGVAVINEDDVMRPSGGAGRPASQRSFGLNAHADFHPQPDSLNNCPPACWEFRLVSPLGEAGIHLSLPGRHNVLNALAAAAAAITVGATLDNV